MGEIIWKTPGDYLLSPVRPADSPDCFNLFSSSLVEWGYFPLNLKNETREFHVLGKNFFFVFSSIGCYLKLNTSNNFSLQCRCFSKPPSILCLNQWKNVQVICCQEGWDDIRYCRATHLHSNTEHHIHYYNISLSYQPTGPLRSSCEDLCWPPVGKKKAYPNHCFSKEEKGLDLFSSTQVRKIHALFVLAPLCPEAEMK